MTKLIAACTWVKKNWKTVILVVAFPLGLLALASKLLRPKVVVTSPELLEHQKLEQSLHEKTEAKKAEAAGKKEARDVVITKNFEAEIAKAQKEAMNSVAAVKDDPAALNDFLKQVGKDVRSK